MIIICQSAAAPQPKVLDRAETSFSLHLSRTKSTLAIATAAAAAARLKEWCNVAAAVTTPRTQLDSCGKHQRKTETVVAC